MQYRVVKKTNGLDKSWWTVQKLRWYYLWLRYTDIGPDGQLGRGDNEYWAMPGRNMFLTKEEACGDFQRMLENIKDEKLAKKVTIVVDNCTED